MNVWDLLPIYLLVVFGVALSLGFGIVAVLVHRTGRLTSSKGDFKPAQLESAGSAPSPAFWNRPSCWLAIKGRSVEAVQKALGVSNPKPCSWWTGLSGETPLFIAPPIRGWVLVLGSKLPDPADDIDTFFHFMISLSRKLGHVQFFSTSPILQHHAWVQADAGKVIRAFAWAGKTLWKQGKMTAAEKQLEVQCPDYEEAETYLFGSEPVCANAEKVPLLASQWSLDPAGVDDTTLTDRQGVAGEWARVI